MVRPSAHPFAHRGTPTATSHSRVRWQPYNATILSSQSRTPPFLPTPASAVYSVSPSPLPLCEDRPRHAHHIARDCQLREIQKSKYALSLVDQTVKSLCEIWHPQDIPHIFLTSCRPAVAPPSCPTTQSLSSLQPFLSNPQLFSPISPTSHPFLVASPLSSCRPRGVYATEAFNIQPPKCDVASMKGFVHEVLRRSRTSGSVLQTALCYIEAIRSKIPGLLRQEKEGLGSTTDTESAEYRIHRADSTSDADDCVFSLPGSSDGLLATVRIDRAENEVDAFASELRIDHNSMSLQKHKATAKALPPLPPLPSPLLCPRRTFLASLILASKFMQDRCYSNRAWAKLSGLPPREIGRCERALGAALEWRLWVGKLPAVQSGSGRFLSKSRSEGDITHASRSRDPSIISAPLAGMDPSPPQWDPVFPRPYLQPTAYAPNSGPGHSFYRQESSMVSLIRRSAGEVLHDTADISPSTISTSPSTPGLSFSPTPTESSFGDRTVQMSSFLDVPTPPPGQFAACAGAQNDKAMLASSGPGLYPASQDVSPPVHAGESRIHPASNCLAFRLSSYGTTLPTWSVPEYA